MKSGTDFKAGFKFQAGLPALGVIQGGNTSPKLFSIYAHVLLKEIEDCPSGLQLDNATKIDVLAYADHIILISSSKLDIQRQIDVTERFGTRNEITFNPEKTMYMEFNLKVYRSADETRRDLWQEYIQLYQTTIKQVKSMKYLVVTLTNDEE
ncbi:RNA-directed DNA polymerase from mobile element jockey-like, partial [Brachionus plicatilis]